MVLCPTQQGPAGTDASQPKNSNPGSASLFCGLLPQDFFSKSFVGVYKYIFVNLYLVKIFRTKSGGLVASI